MSMPLPARQFLQLRCHLAPLLFGPEHRKEAITVFFRDVKNICGVITLAWMYLTPIFYSLESFYQPGIENANLAMNTLGLFIRRFNPMYIYIQQFRYLIMQYSPAWEVPCGVLMERGAIVAAAVLIVGAVTFRRTENKFILYI